MSDTMTEYYKSHPRQEPKTIAKDVVWAFNSFIGTYERFRKDNGLDAAKSNGFEVCTSLLDKTGRIARQVKHKERNDPKPDWPDGLTEAMTGTIVYMLMLLKLYNIDIGPGMKKELESAIKQWSK